MLLDFLKTIIFGIVEGISEWLPISSTGHLIIIQEFIQLNVRKEYWDIFIVIIQLGAIFAVLVNFFKDLNPLLAKNKSKKKSIYNTWIKIIIGCIPAGIVGILLNDWIEDRLMGNLVVSITLIAYGIIFIVVEKKNNKEVSSINSIEDMSYITAFKIGLFQMLSLIPGTSRSGSTIIGGLLLGVSRPLSANFSFYMSIPIMFGASFLKLIDAFFKGFTFSSYEIILLIVGMVTAFIVSLITINLFLKYIKNNDFTAFGWYRIIVGIIVLLLYF